MSYRKSLARRLFNTYKVSAPSAPLENTAISFSSHDSLVPPNAAKSNFLREYLTSSECESTDKKFYRRFLHPRSIYQSAKRLPEFLTLPVGEKLKEKIKSVNNTRDRLQFDGLKVPVEENERGESLYGVSIRDAKKLLQLTKAEKVKAKLREIPESSISYSKFVRICVEGCENEDRGLEFAKMLDEAGNVIVLGNVVFLRPDQVAKSVETIISESIAIPNDPRRKELDQMEKQKGEIDQTAKALVRGELYCGFGLLAIQTLGCMRLTFWELNWDVMEPICFFAASLHFGAAYAFFLTTSKEPSFQSYFQCRFKTKQKKLMKARNFDIEKYIELCKAYNPNFNGELCSSFNRDERD